MKTPHDFTIGVPAVCTLYLAEIQRLQTHGPYHIGGWSAGGVMAYEVTLGLVAMGETVSTLFLIDSPCPIELKPLPVRLFSYFDELGLLGGRGAGSTPAWLIPHFESSVRELAAYEPRPMPAGTSLRIIAVWARDGVCEERKTPRFEWTGNGEEEPRTIKWLLEKRTDFGHNGWGKLVGQNRIHIHVVEGNHFSMMGGTQVTALGDLIRQELMAG
ncbi:hypothetical protein ONS95_005125 [Cadophora gregata]|uniref:uncharacterized protein n=1 Tax=Cadophora gregata TaxID=51156 RepID=UPI0026DD1877|nr:uncharacterized protein ONS95_005125 [Cadophora gregata]KAK0104859.1 hypothetical protein ONS95_005125 [Cadophora gregata]KAK0115062.1 hypothetical protein ONS96_013532 [Cadophora gregata f. sp. sojae]